MAPDEALAEGVLLEKAGIDAIELTGGLLRTSMMGPSPSRAGINSPAKEAYHQTEARAFKKQLDLPLILIGGIRSFEKAEELVSEGVADYIALCRPFIREPDLIGRWQAGNRHPAECTTDTLCFRPGLVGVGV